MKKNSETYDVTSTSSFSEYDKKICVLTKTHLYEGCP